MARPLPAALPLAAAALLAPAAALACAVCGAGEDASSGPFLWSTLALSALPLLMLGGGAWWLWTRLRERPAEDAHGRLGPVTPIAEEAAAPLSEPGRVR